MVIPSFGSHTQLLLLLCTINFSFAGQPEKFPWSELQMGAKGSQGSGSLSNLKNSS